MFHAYIYFFFLFDLFEFYTVNVVSVITVSQRVPYSVDLIELYNDVLTTLVRL